MSADTAVLAVDIQQSFRALRIGAKTMFPHFAMPCCGCCRLPRTAAGRWCASCTRKAMMARSVPPQGWCVRLNGCRRMPQDVAATFRKGVHNAFTDTALEGWLRERGIRRVVVIGIRTEQCCETTTRIASDLGFDVDFVTEATLTFPMVHAASGRRYDVDEIKQHTELVLDGRFARIRSVDALLTGD